jgi:hypothetical protein
MTSTPQAGMLIAATLIVAIHAHTRAAPNDPGTPQVLCSARMPETIRFPRELQSHVRIMLQRSPTFRWQCRRIAEAAMLRVNLQLNPAIALDRSYRALTVIRRSPFGWILASVEISPAGSPVEWIAHELEHVIEQIEGIRLPALVDREAGVWRSSPGVFETTRAIDAGRTVAGELRANSGRAYKFVD